MKTEVQQASQIEEENTGDANTQNCQNETVNRLECELSGNVGCFPKPKKLLRKQAEAYRTKHYGQATQAQEEVRI